TRPSTPHRRLRRTCSRQPQAKVGPRSRRRIQRNSDEKVQSKAMGRVAAARSRPTAHVLRRGRSGGIAISTRSADVPVAQQLSMLGSLPPLAIVALMSLNVIEVSTALAVGLAAALFVVDLFAWRVVSSMFDRERLVTGRRAERRRHGAPLTEYSEVTPVGRE